MKKNFKTIRLLYPDYLGGGLETYYFGSMLLSHILPENPAQELIRVNIAPPDGKERPITDGIYAKNEVLAGIKDAKEKISTAKPEKIITIGGNCLVSLAPFDYLHGIYPNAGIVWIDAHPDVSTASDYPNAHAMILGALIGKGEACLSDMMENKKFEADEILYIGLQNILDYQKKFLADAEVNFAIQDKKFVSEEEILSFIRRFDHLLLHLDIDVLDENLFHSTYFANKELVGDGSGGGCMTVEKLTELLHLITENSDVVGFSIAEYLPFDEHKLHKMFSSISMFTKQ